MTEWIRYVKAESIRRLKEEGRELLGETLYITEKRDGQNVSVWKDNKGKVRISSHNLENASAEIQIALKSTPQYKRILEFFDNEFTPDNIIVYGELLMKVSPTRIEKNKKNLKWLVFDILDTTTMRYLDYTTMHQMMYTAKIPIVELYEIITPKTMEELREDMDLYMKYCKKHYREGIVGKCYSNQVFFKEKINLPKRPRIEKFEKTVQYPLMPVEVQQRAMLHAIEEVCKGEHNFTKFCSAKFAMPVVAKMFAVEAKEHFYSVPKNLYSLWMDEVDKLPNEVT